MNRLIQALLLTLSLALGAGGAMAAKDDAKPAGADKAAASAASGEKATKKSDSAASASADKGKSGAQIDINTASEDDLKTLPQIGDARASAIVKGRPYARKDELVSKKVLTQKQYDGIKDKIIAKQGAGGGADKASAGASSATTSKSSAAGATGDKATKKSDTAK